MVVSGRRGTAPLVGSSRYMASQSLVMDSLQGVGRLATSCHQLRARLILSPVVDPALLRYKLDKYRRTHLVCGIGGTLSQGFGHSYDAATVFIQGIS